MHRKPVDVRLAATRRRPGSLAVLALVLCLIVGSGVAGAASITALRQRLATSPEDVKLRFLLARSLSEAGDHEDAVNQYQRILSRRAVPKVMFHLGLEFAKMGNLAGAVSQWNQVLAEKPNNIKTIGYLALALHKQALTVRSKDRQRDLLRQSLRHWTNIRRIDPSSAKARYYGGIAYYKLGQYSKAVRQWLLLLRNRKNHRKTMLWMAKGLVRMAQTSKGAEKAKYFANAKALLQKLVRLELGSRSGAIYRQASALLEKLNSGQLARQLPSVSSEDEDPDAVLRDPPPTEEEDLNHRRPPGLRTMPDFSKNLDGRNSIEAEVLFLDGLEYKEKGNFEKALFAFLQAIDMKPNFCQVYLQVGEVYMQLAKLAPTRNQYDERISLALQSLEKVLTLAPASLLAHASQSKIVLIKKMRGQGFAEHHLATARKAVSEKREEDAFEEYILLLSNIVFRPDVFFELASIIPSLSEGNRQDLQYFAEELVKQHKDNPHIDYLAGRSYLGVNKVKLATEFLDRFLRKLPTDEESLAPYAVLAEGRRAARVDRYLLARLLFRASPLKHRKRVKSLLETFRKESKPQELFHGEALELWNQLFAASRKGPPQGNVWKKERQELTAKLGRTKALFENFGCASHHDEELHRQLTVFCEAHGDNALARFILAWNTEVLLERGVDGGDADKTKDMQRRSTEAFAELLTMRSADPLWHFLMGSQALRWNLLGKGRAHLKVAGDILLANGAETHGNFANRALFEARRNNIPLGRTQAAEILLDTARQYDRTSLNYYVVRAELKIANGQWIDAGYSLMAWALAALSDPWSRAVVLCDLALLLLWASLAALLSFAIGLVAKYLDFLHHFFVEYWKTNGLLLPISLIIPLLSLLVAPTGLIIFLPVILWPMMRVWEKRFYVALAIVPLLVPLLLPMPVTQNHDLIHQAENLQRGNFNAAYKYFSALAKERPGDDNVLHALALCQLKRGELKDAEILFQKLARSRNDSARLVVDLGVIQARKGQIDGPTGALTLFQRAVSLDATSVPALLNLSQVYRHLGKKEKASQYFRYAKALAPEGSLERYQDVSPQISPLVLKDGGLPPESFETRFTFFSGDSFLQANLNLVLFLSFMLLGFGLVGFLLFAWGRLGLVVLRCRRCKVVICTICHHGVDGRSLCENCKEHAHERSQPTAHLSHQTRIFKRSFLLNLLFPGSAFVSAGRPFLSVILPLLFWSAARFTYTGGGVLVNKVFMNLDIGLINGMLWGAAGFAVFCYLASQVFFYQLRNDVEIE